MALRSVLVELGSSSFEVSFSLSADSSLQARAASVAQQGTMASKQLRLTSQTGLQTTRACSAWPCAAFSLS